MLFYFQNIQQITRQIQKAYIPYYYNNVYKILYGELEIYKNFNKKTNSEIINTYDLNKIKSFLKQLNEILNFFTFLSKNLN